MTAQIQYCDDETFWNRLDANDRDTRIYVDADALLYRASDQQTAIVIQNLSIHGVRATTDFPPLVGEAIEIDLAGQGRFQGVVRWRHQNKFGVHTFEHIDLNLFSDQIE
jgi:hypothetical protein|tara:strand:+ start:42030 stop:42356 length:327 start_codon:yes stop_codon:yes gene_type:complete